MKANEPVMLAATIVAMVEALIIMFVTMGWISWDSAQVASFNNFIVAFVALGAIAVPLGGAYFARKQVTPVANPRNADGAELVVKAE